MSPSDLGQTLKPFVFLDLFEKDGPAFSGALHPHSGIATVTYTLEGRVQYIDPDGTTGILPPGAVEWMRAGRGMWHGGGVSSGRVLGSQLWIALPPELELSPYESHYVAPETVTSVGPARVLLGSLGATNSKIRSALPVTYLGLKLSAGETWRYAPPAGHTILWIAVATGALEEPDLVHAGEMVVFVKSEEAVIFKARTNTDFVLGSAVPHDHELALGYYSVHTSMENLLAGETEIMRIKEKLTREGRL